jgi:hypothetical protein
MDGSMQDIRPSDNGEHRPEPKIAAPTAFEALLVFTAGWLGGSGLFTALNPAAEGSVRVLAAAEAVAAALWFAPRLRLAGFGAMLAVLVVAILRDLLNGAPPGALIFYAAVVVYLAVVERARAAG